MKLAGELGLARQLSGAEYRELRQNRDRADHAARALYERVKARRFQLLHSLHALRDLEATAHRLGPDHAETWDTLSTVYAERPVILTELTILENAGVADLVKFLSADGTTRESAIACVIGRGGLYGLEGRFVEVSP